MKVEHKCMLMEVKRFAVHDGPGVRTTLFLKGCTLKCVWCHNPEGISAKPQLAYYPHKCIHCGECVKTCPEGAHTFSAEGHIFLREKCVVCGACEGVCLGEALQLFGREASVDEAYALVTEDKAFYGDTGGVTVSGGEPLLQADFVRALFEKLKSDGYQTAVDTCGNVPWESFEKVLGLTDIFLYDIKHIDSSAHRQLTGAGNERILDNLKRLSAAGVRIEMRMPLVPSANDSQETLKGIGAFLGKLTIERIKVLPYHAMARSKYRALGMEDTMPDAPSPTDEALARAVKILRAHGVNALSGRE